MIISLKSECRCPAKNSSSVRSSAWSAGSCPATGEMITDLQSECSSPAKNSPTSMILVLQPAKIIISLQSKCSCPAKNSSSVRLSAWSAGSCPATGEMITDLQSECSSPAKNSPTSMVLVLQPAKIIISLQSECCCPANCTSMVSWVLSCDHPNNYISQVRMQLLGEDKPIQHSLCRTTTEITEVRMQLPMTREIMI